MKKFIFFLVLPCLVLQAARSQTIVSGGIYANTSWTQAGSPYIIADTVVVFPGVTLTIQPGVTVKFADQNILEIRQAELIANGAAGDSITFTSNSSSPTPGIYYGIYVNGGSHTSTFNYCRFSFATTGINVTVSDSVVVNHSDFSRNITGMQFIGSVGSEVASLNNTVFEQNANQGLLLRGLRYSDINTCNFISNTTDGLTLDDLEGPMSITMENCTFTNNGTGLYNSMHHLVMNDCNFLNNQNGVEGFGYLSPFDSYQNFTQNCVFNYNQTGISNMGRMKFDNCKMNHNQSGMTSGGVNSIKNCTLDSNNVIAISTFNDSILNCSIRYNGAGIQAGSLTVISGNDIEYNSSTNISCGSGITSISGNTIRFGQIGISSTITGTLTITKNIIEDNELGIDLNTSSASISCNKICSNTTYDFKYGASSNLDAGHNFWCTADSTSTEAVIYDGYDNINYGLVSFMPLDSECYLETAVSEIEVNSPVTIYPNPFSLQTIIRPGRAFHNATLFLFNISGQQVKKLENISGPDITLSRDTLPAGLYFMQLMQDDKALIKKLMISDN